MINQQPQQPHLKYNSYPGVIDYLARSAAYVNKRLLGYKTDGRLDLILVNSTIGNLGNNDSPASAVLLQGNSGQGKTAFMEMAIGKDNIVVAQKDDSRGTVQGHPSPINPEVFIPGALSRYDKKLGLFGIDEIGNASNPGPYLPIFGSEFGGSVVMATTNYPNFRRVLPLDHALLSRMITMTMEIPDEEPITKDRIKALEQPVISSQSTVPLIPELEIRQKFTNKIQERFKTSSKVENYVGILEELLKNSSDLVVDPNVPKIDMRKITAWHHLSFANRLLTEIVSYKKDKSLKRSPIVDSIDYARTAAFVFPSSYQLSPDKVTEFEDKSDRSMSYAEKQMALRVTVARLAIQALFKQARTENDHKTLEKEYDLGKMAFVHSEYIKLFE